MKIIIICHLSSFKHDFMAHSRPVNLHQTTDRGCRKFRTCFPVGSDLWCHPSLTRCDVTKPFCILHKAPITPPALCTDCLAVSASPPHWVSIWILKSGPSEQRGVFFFFKEMEEITPVLRGLALQSVMEMSWLGAVMFRWWSVTRAHFNRQTPVGVSALICLSLRKQRASVPGFFVSCFRFECSQSSDRNVDTARFIYTSASAHKHRGLWDLSTLEYSVFVSLDNLCDCLRI